MNPILAGPIVGGPSGGPIAALSGSPVSGIVYISANGLTTVASRMLISESPEPTITISGTATPILATAFNLDSGLDGAVQNRASSVRYRSNGLNRWTFVKTGALETGGNAGSNYEMRASDDAGVQIDAPISVIRAAAGLITIGGGGRPITLALTNQGLRVNGQTNGAGVAAGTLGNAPVAGNPSFWLPLNIAGTIRYFPGW